MRRRLLLPVLLASLFPRTAEPADARIPGAMAAMEDMQLDADVATNAAIAVMCGLRNLAWGHAVAASLTVDLKRRAELHAEAFGGRAPAEIAAAAMMNAAVFTAQEEMHLFGRTACVARDDPQTLALLDLLAEPDPTVH